MAWKRVWTLLVITAIVAALMSACTRGGIAPTPTATAATTPAPTETPPAAGTPAPQSLDLTLLVPDGGTARLDDSISPEATFGGFGIPVAGITRPDATVTVNGAMADVDEDGRFTHAIELDEGPNLIEVTASDLLGNRRSIDFIVYQVTPSDVPLHVLWPAPDTTVSSSAVTVTGATGIDATVTVNGAVADVDELGIFSAVVTLEAGPNVIEVVASTLRGDSRSETLVVFSDR